MPPQNTMPKTKTSHGPATTSIKPTTCTCYRTRINNLNLCIKLLQSAAKSIDCCGQRQETYQISVHLKWKQYTQKSATITRNAKRKNEKTTSRSLKHTAKTTIKSKTRRTVNLDQRQQQRIWSRGWLSCVGNQEKRVLLCHVGRQADRGAVQWHHWCPVSSVSQR